MDQRPIVCGNCGAPLSVLNGTQFVTCNHCSSTLEIRCNDSVTYSKKIAQLDARTDRIESELEEIRHDREQNLHELEVSRLEQELEALDRDRAWNEPNFHVRRFRLVTQLADARRAVSNGD